MLKFLVFADFHYFKGVYHAPVDSLRKIMARAATEEVDFVIQMGDFSNHLAASPEIIPPYYGNTYGIPVYGIYGNHELEKCGNTMESINETLCNRPVCFGAEPETDDTGYWYADVKGYRLIGLDTCYMYHREEDRYYHNSAETWPFVPGTEKPNSLGTSQLAWLRVTIADAAEKGLKVLVFSHAALSGLWSSAPDADKARAIFAEFPGTVTLAVNGHLHTDRLAVRDGVAYFDVNTVHNGYWEPYPEHHYPPEQTFSYVPYEGGIPGSPEVRPLTSLRQAKNTWFFTEPTSAVVTISETDGGTDISVDGCETAWEYGIEPPKDLDGAVYPGIRSRSVKI